MATKTVLDFTTVTDVEDADILYLIRGVGTTRDKKITMGSIFNPLLFNNDGVVSAPIISWASDTDTGIWRAGSNTIAFSGSGSEIMRIVGTTVSIKNTTVESTDFQGVLQLGPISSVVSGASAELGILQNVYHQPGTWYYRTTDEASRYYQNDGIHAFEVAASGTADTAITWTEALRIDVSGNVSIKNSSLENWKTILSVLQLGGNGFLETQTTQQAGNYMTIGCNSYWDQTDDRWEYISTDEASAYWQGNGAHSFNIAVSGTADTAITWIEALKIDNAGKIITNDGGTPLCSTGGMHLFTSDTATVVNGAADNLVIEENGNAGLTIASGSTNQGSIFFGDVGGGTVGQIIYIHNTDVMSFYAAAQEVLKLDSARDATITAGGLSRNGQAVLNCKIIDIGDWNMDTTGTLNVAHGLGAEYKKIRNLNLVIRHDDDILYYEAFVTVSGVSLTTIDATNIQLSRVNGGTFDSTGFDSTSYNRGWIYLEYTN
jgi:hypothetical protein